MTFLFDAPVIQTFIGSGEQSEDQHGTAHAVGCLFYEWGR